MFGVLPTVDPGKNNLPSSTSTLDAVVCPARKQGTNVLLGLDAFLLLVTLLLLRGSGAVVVVVDALAVGNVGHTGGRDPHIGVLGDAGMDAEGVDLWNK